MDLAVEILAITYIVCVLIYALDLVNILLE